MLNSQCSNTGAPKLINSDLFLEKLRVFIGSVARFSRKKSLLISFGAPVVQTILINISGDKQVAPILENT